MNKLLLALPIIALLVVGGVYQFHNTEDLELSHYDVTFTEWAQCYINLPPVSDSCLNSESYNRAAGAFANLTNVESANVLPACVAFNTYRESAWASQSINQNDYFIDCYLNDEVLEAAQLDVCFYQQYYYPLYLKCTYAPTQAEVQIQNSNSTTTFSQWATCYTNLNQTQQACQTTQEYYTAAAQFNDLTYAESAYLTPACQSYYAYFLSAQADQLLDGNQFYENCFLSAQIKSIVESNSCFNTYYYKPIYVNCAGF